jgi:hypothetical protein
LGFSPCGQSLDPGRFTLDVAAPLGFRRERKRRTRNIAESPLKLQSVINA